MRKPIIRVSSVMAAEAPLTVRCSVPSACYSLSLPTVSHTAGWGLEGAGGAMTDQSAGGNGAACREQFDTRQDRARAAILNTQAEDGQRGEWMWWRRREGGQRVSEQDRCVSEMSGELPIFQPSTVTHTHTYINTHTQSKQQDICFTKCQLWHVRRQQQMFCLKMLWRPR